MRSFDCPTCGGLLFFENSVCLACDSAVGYDRATPRLRRGAARHCACANAALAECNWLVDDAGGAVRVLRA